MATSLEPESWTPPCRTNAGHGAADNNAIEDVIVASQALNYRRETLLAGFDTPDTQEG